MLSLGGNRGSRVLKTKTGKDPKSLGRGDDRRPLFNLMCGWLPISRRHAKVIWTQRRNDVATSKPSLLKHPGPLLLLAAHQEGYDGNEGENLEISLKSLLLPGRSSFKSREAALCGG